MNDSKANGKSVKYVGKQKKVHSVSQNMTPIAFITLGKFYDFLLQYS